MIPRSAPIERLPVASTSRTAPVALPGLVSSLRPIKRLATQLADEATLVRRFTYKNKNQHKGCGWWREVVEVDRVTCRLVAELAQLLAQFEVDMSSKQEIGVVSEAALVPGLLRLSRSCALADKTVEVLLNSSGLLEQLIHSRAFLAFSVVVVALISRLHAITTVLAAELAKASTVLVRLIKASSKLPELTIAVGRLPRELRRYIQLNPAATIAKSEPPSSATISRLPSPAPLALGGDEIGQIVSRDPQRNSIHSPSKPTTAHAAPTARGSQSRSHSSSGIDRAEPRSRLAAVADRTSLTDRLEAATSPRASPSGASPVPPPQPRNNEQTPPKPARKIKLTNTDSELPKKKKKKKKSELDEIDMLFG